MKFLKLFVFVLISFTIFTSVHASGKYTSNTLKEACLEDGITCSFTERAYDENKPSIYIFRRTGCSYCKQMMSYIASLMDEYGDKINVVTYEAYINDSNLPLARLTAQKLGETLSGFPYTVIGSKSFEGYLESYNESIVAAIENVISGQDQYDAVKAVLNGSSEEIESSNRKVVIVFLFGIIVVFSLFLGYKISAK